MPTMTMRRHVDAPAEVVWPVVADHVGYADAAPNLSKVEVLEGRGLGMRRRCHDARGRGWSETCTLWEEGSRYRFEVDTAAPDYPYPLDSLSGTWAVEPAGGGSVVSMRFDFEPRYGLLGRALAFAIRPEIRYTVRRLFDNWEREIARRHGVYRPEAA